MISLFFGSPYVNPRECKRTKNPTCEECWLFSRKKKKKRRVELLVSSLFFPDGNGAWHERRTRQNHPVQPLFLLTSISPKPSKLSHNVFLRPAKSAALITRLYGLLCRSITHRECSLQLPCLRHCQPPSSFQSLTGLLLLLEIHA